MVIFPRFLVGLPGRVIFLSTFRDPTATAIKWVPLVSTIYGYDSAHAVVDMYIYIYVCMYVM